jgi:hypothetical protein
MNIPRRLIARFDVSLEISEPRALARAAWVADWLRRVARAIERADLPRDTRTGSAGLDSGSHTTPPV